MPQTDYSPWLYAFTARLPDEDQDFIAAYRLHAAGWRERVPAQEMPRAVDLQRRAVAYLNSLRNATGTENQVTIIMRKRR